MARQQKAAVRSLDSYARTDVHLDSYAQTDKHLDSCARQNVVLESYVNIEELAAQIGRVQTDSQGRIIITSTGQKIRVFD